MPTTTHRTKSRLGPQRGQAMPIIALMILILIAMVGLAVDGGAMYADRRTAQNSSDAAAMAGASVMLDRYNTMVLNYAYDVDGTAQDDQDIDAAITGYATKHGIPRSNLEAYYVRDNKQVIGTTQVGQTGLVPWTQGAKGIVVKNRAESTAFFMKIFGWDKVGASSTSSAFMGVAADSSQGLPVMPVGFFTETSALNNLVFGQEYTLISSDITDTIGSGNWGYLDFNGNASSNVDRAWLDCGFNPNVRTTRQWQEWCPSSANVGQAIAPTQYFTCADANCTYPNSNAQFAYELHWGDGIDGWWLAGQTGTTMSNCHDLSQLVDEIDGREFLVPVFDYWINGNGSGSRFHLARIIKVRITSAQIDCHPNNGDAHWSIRALYESLYVAGATGRHGDLRHTSGQTVFLDN